MTVGEPTERTLRFATARQEREARQAQHEALAATLEDELGVSIENLAELYGETILDADSPNAEILDRWTTLLSTLRDTDQPLVALAAVDELAAKHSHQLGLSSTATSILVVTDPHSAAIEFGYTDEGRFVATLRATGYRLLHARRQNPNFDNLSAAPQDIAVPIASKPVTTLDFTRRPDLTTQVYAASSYFDIYNKIIHQPIFAYGDSRDAFFDRTLNYLLDASTSSDSECPWEIAPGSVSQNS